MLRFFIPIRASKIQLYLGSAASQCFGTVGGLMVRGAVVSGLNVYIGSKNDQKDDLEESQKTLPSINASTKR